MLKIVLREVSLNITKGLFRGEKWTVIYDDETLKTHTNA